MKLLKQSFLFASNNLMLEWKDKHTIAGVLVQVAVSVFLVYLTLQFVDKTTWNAMFWLVIIFSTMQGISKGFFGVQQGHYLFWNQLITPGSFILGKLISNAVLMVAFSLLIFVTFGFWMGFQAVLPVRFLIVMILSSVGISSVFTFVSAVVSKSEQPALLMPVLALPVVLPFVLTGIQSTEKAAIGLNTTGFAQDVLLLLALNTMTILFALVLFRYLWKE